MHIIIVDSQGYVLFCSTSFSYSMLCSIFSMHQVQTRTHSLFCFVLTCQSNTNFILWYIMFYYLLLLDHFFAYSIGNTQPLSNKTCVITFFKIVLYAILFRREQSAQSLSTKTQTVIVPRMIEITRTADEYGLIAERIEYGPLSIIT